MSRLSMYKHKGQSLRHRAVMKGVSQLWTYCINQYILFWQLQYVPKGESMWFKKPPQSEPLKLVIYDILVHQQLDGLIRHISNRIDPVHVKCALLGRLIKALQSLQNEPTQKRFTTNTWFMKICHNKFISPDFFWPYNCCAPQQKRLTGKHPGSAEVSEQRWRPTLTGWLCRRMCPPPSKWQTHSSAPPQRAEAHTQAQTHTQKHRRRTINETYMFFPKGFWFWSEKSWKYLEISQLILI